MAYAALRMTMHVNRRARCLAPRTKKSADVFTSTLFVVYPTDCNHHDGNFLSPPHEANLFLAAR